MHFQQDNCIICLGNLEENEAIAELKCKHIFHQECLKNWIDSTNPKGQTCMVCSRHIWLTEKESSNRDEVARAINANMEVIPPVEYQVQDSNDLSALEQQEQMQSST